MSSPELKLSALDEGDGWSLVTGDGTTYTLKLRDGQLHVSKTNISVVSAAASLGIGVAGSTGIAVSGAGDVALNSISSETNA